MSKPQTVQAVLAANRTLSADTFVLTFGGCAELADARPGQFVMLRDDDWGSDPLLPRAFSLLSVRSDGEVDVLAKVSGKASRLLRRAEIGAAFTLLGPLGNAFPDPDPARPHWLVAGGVGLAPLLMHARHAARDRGAAPAPMTMFYGGRTAADLVLLDDIAATGVELVLATEDGSRGHPGYVTAAVERALERAAAPAPTLLACGPEPMLVAVARLARARRLAAYLSLEGEMACGIGACLACAVPCESRAYRYACVDGPVFSLADLAGAYAGAEGAP